MPPHSPLSQRLLELIEPHSLLQKLKKIIIDDELGICGDLDAEMDALIGTYVDEWAQAVTDPELRKTFKQFANTVRFASLLRLVARARVADAASLSPGRATTCHRGDHRAWPEPTCRLAQGFPSAQVRGQGCPDGSRSVDLDPVGDDGGFDAHGGEHDVRSYSFV
jgi:hypothetical protein